jgi:hypothetical protein
MLKNTIIYYSQEFSVRFNWPTLGNVMPSNIIPCNPALEIPPLIVVALSKVLQYNLRNQSDYSYQMK